MGKFFLLLLSTVIIKTQTCILTAYENNVATYSKHCSIGKQNRFSYLTNYSKYSSTSYLIYLFI